MLQKMAVLALAMGTAMTLNAQQGPGPEGPHGPGPGPRFGFGGFGGFGGFELDRPFELEHGQPVTNQPFVASASTTDTRTNKEGKTVTHQATDQIWRDASGRTRAEVTAPAEGNRPALHRGEIFDPVKHTVTVLDFNKKVAIVRQLPPPRGPRQNPNAQQEHQRPLPPGVTETPLPGKQIAGVYATGKEITHTIPAGRRGNAEPITETSQVYTSPDLKIVLFDSHNDPHNNFVHQVNTLTRADQNELLFEVPADFTVRNAPERGRGGFRGGRGGPGGPPPQGGADSPAE